LCKYDPDYAAFSCLAVRGTFSRPREYDQFTHITPYTTANAEGNRGADRGGSTN